MEPTTWVPAEESSRPREQPVQGPQLRATRRQSLVWLWFGDQVRDWRVMRSEKSVASRTAEPCKEFEFYFTCSRETLKGIKQGSQGIQYMFSKDCSGCCVENGCGGAKRNRETS